MKFDGSDYIPKIDDARLSVQHEDIKNLMLDGQWRTLSEISVATTHPEASISAQLRHLRKERFGSFLVNKRRRGEPAEGLFEYQVLPPNGDKQIRESYKNLFLQAEEFLKLHGLLDKFKETTNYSSNI